jgi:hypothetical protein
MFSFFKTAHAKNEEFIDCNSFEKQVFVIENAPRKVKLDQTVRAVWALVVTFGLAWSISLFGATKKDPTDFIPAIIVCIVSVGLFVAFILVWRDRNLLRNGISTVGKVIAQKKVKVGRGSNSVITYSFPVGPGKPMIGQGTDHTKTYSENSPLLVCFDPKDISRNLALCCTYWRVRDRDGKPSNHNYDF